jgi:hypothetical protein
MADRLITENREPWTGFRLFNTRTPQGVVQK